MASSSVGDNDCGNEYPADMSRSSSTSRLVEFISNASSYSSLEMGYERVSSAILVDDSEMFSDYIRKNSSTGSFYGVGTYLPARRLDLQKSKYDQATIRGRVMHFFYTTNPLNVFATDEELQRAKVIVESYIEGCEDKSLSDDEIWEAKSLYDSAYHPQTGEKVWFFGRMSFQCWGNMVLSGCMLTFHSNSAQFFWQFANQSFNAVVNYSNRNASVEMSGMTILRAYCLATSIACFASVACNVFFGSEFPGRPWIAQQFGPYLAVALANVVNVSMMRYLELKEGLQLHLENGTETDITSTAAAFDGVASCIVTRWLMAIPPLTFPPIIVRFCVATYPHLFQSYPLLEMCTTIMFTGVFLATSIPLCLAVFPQSATIHVNRVEKEKRDMLQEKFPNESIFIYNKGL